MNMERTVPRDGAGAGQDPRPVVPLPRDGLRGWVIALIGLLLAGLLFLFLEDRRTARGQPDARNGSAERISAPAPLVVPDAKQTMPWPTQPMPLPEQSAIVTQPRLAPAEPTTAVWEQPGPSPSQSPPQVAPLEPASPAPAWEPPPPPAAEAPMPSRDGPAIVQDSGESRQWSGEVGPSAAGAAISGSDNGSASARATPRPIGDLSQVVSVGTMIEAVLETAVDSSRPGMVRALVSRPVRSFDGSRVLIPRGARLVGEVGGQTEGRGRLHVQWTQLILPNGIALEINSPAANAAGQAGLDAKRHGGFGRFVGGLLQTAVGVGTAVIGTRGYPVYYGAPIAGNVGQLAPANESGRRLTVAAGAKINIVVARTLDFSSSGT